MPEVNGAGAAAAGLVTPIRVEGVFDDPGAIRRPVERNGPYRTMASYLPDSAVRGRQATAGDGVLPHFRATWAAGGRPLADGAEVILSEHPPFTNFALVADNNRMYHRIGWIGDPAAASPVLCAAAQIGHHADGGWIISDAGTSPVRYDDRDIRISILWKAQVRPRPERSAAAPLATLRTRS